MPSRRPSPVTGSDHGSPDSPAAPELDASRLRWQLAAIVEGSDDAIIGKTLSGIITSWNAAAERMYGYTAAEMVGRTIDAIVPPDRQDEPAALLDLVAEGRPVRHFETVRRRKDGVLLDVALTTSPIRDESGTIVGASIIAHDITEQKATQHALREAEAEARAASEYARSLIEASLDPLVTISPDGKITDVNEATIKATGVPRVQLVGSDFAVYFTEPAQARAGYLQAVEQGFVRDFPLVMRHVSGRLIDVVWNAAVYRNEAGELQGVFAAARDVTGRKRVEDALADSEARLRRVVDANILGIFFWDLNGDILEVNDAMLAMLGRSREDAGSLLRWTDITPPEYREADARARAQIVASGVCTPYEKEYLRKDGSRVPVMIGAASFTLTPYRGVAFALDISARKRIEQALVELNAELEQRVAARTADLQAANRELEGFTYSVSHDLRAPLRALQGFSSILLAEYADLLPPEAQRYLGLISANASHMGALVDDLLEFARTTRQPLRREPVDMNALVAAALDQLSTHLEGRHADVRRAVLPVCTGDAPLLRQVWINLLSNALKFTRGRDPAIIDVGSAPELARPGEVVYFVRDNGVGFDMQYAGKLFGVFHRLHKTEEYEGTGIGLALVARIVQRHGGRVWAESAPDHGAMFYVALPRD